MFCACLRAHYCNELGTRKASCLHHSSQLPSTFSPSLQTTSCITRNVNQNYFGCDIYYYQIQQWKYRKKFWSCGEAYLVLESGTFGWSFVWKCSAKTRKTMESEFKIWTWVWRIGYRAWNLNVVLRGERGNEYQRAIIRIIQKTAAQFPRRYWKIILKCFDIARGNANSNGVMVSGKYSHVPIQLQVLS